MHIEHDRRDGNENRDLYKGPLRALVHVDTQGLQGTEEAAKVADVNNVAHRKRENSNNNKTERHTERGREREIYFFFFFHQPSLARTKSYAGWWRTI